MGNSIAGTGAGKGLGDYHTHTTRCGHAEGSMSAYVEAAIGMGLSEIGFSDHLPMAPRQDPSLTMSDDELPLYVDEVLALRAKYPEIAVKLGIEADYVPGCEAWLPEVLGRYPFDYVMGSVHFIDGWGFDDSRNIDGWSQRSVDDVHTRYYDALVAAIDTRLFDIVAHPDLVKKFGFKPAADQTPHYERVGRAAAEAGIAVELSSAGLRKPVAEIYPSAAFLKLLVTSGVAFTLGSDAHRPQDVGKDFDLLLQLLGDCGGGRLMSFEDRRSREAAVVDARGQ